jgi:protein transport protein SEC61 subunit alpha
MYGPLKELGFLNAFLIVMQLTFACVLVIYWDEMLTKGYGIGSGQNLFLVTNICESFFWKLFSPVTIKTQSGIQFEGIAVALFQFIVQKKSLLLGLKLALFRGNLVNLSNVIVTAVIFLFVLYIQNFHVNLPIYYKQHGG